MNKDDDNDFIFGSIFISFVALKKGNMIRKCLTIQLAVEEEQKYIASLSPEARERYLAKQKKDNEVSNAKIKEARDKWAQNKNKDEDE